MAGQLLSIFRLLGKAEMDKQRNLADWVLDYLCTDLCKSRQGLCSLRCRIRHIRDQVHHCGFRYERVSWILDAADQINLLAAGNRVGPLSRKRRAECTLCGVYW